MNNLTSLVSCFVRAYHYNNNNYRILNDSVASKLLTKEEYVNISNNMSNGIIFFNKDFKGTKEEALRYIVNNNLSPSVLARSTYTENMLRNDIKLGCKQYVILASGYDTYAYRNNNDLKIFELDKEEIIKDKINRLDKSNINHNNVSYVGVDFSKNNWIKELLNTDFNKSKKTFCSMLGISYYLTKEEFSNLLKELSSVLQEGSTIVFDYPNNIKNEQAIINFKLAKEANEPMKSLYDEFELVNILETNGFLMYEDLNNDDINKNYFYNYNIMNPNNKIYAPINVKYCLAVNNIKKF